MQTPFLLPPRSAVKRVLLFAAVLTVSGGATLGTLGCARQTPMVMAPPMSQGPQMSAPPMGNGGGNYAQGANTANPNAGVFDWHDVPVNQQVPVQRAVFDQGGYQIYAASGETITVPFVNQNLYAMKFGQSSDGTMYFVNDGQAPTLFVPRGGFLENTMAANARWYPFAQNFAYERPVYVGLAPSWTDFVGMGWYPGMTYYGGYWGARPWAYGMGYSAMPGLVINIGGNPYYGWGGYHNYYYSHPYNRVYVRSAPSYRYNSVGRRSASSFGSSGGRTTGSFSSGRRSYGSSGTSGSFGRSAGSSGSFGSFGRSSTFGQRSSGSSGSFGSSSGSSNTFGTSSNRPSGSFGSGSSGYSSSGRRSSGSFGSGSSGYGGSFGGRSGSFGGGSTSRPSGGFSGGGGGLFGGGRSSGGFSSGRSSGGFGGGRSSFGGGRSSFGGGRRR